MTPLAIGFRVKSGHAIAVALTGPAGQPSPLVRVDVALSDPNIHETRQPYHDGLYHQQNDPKEIARRIRIIERSARASVDALLDGIAGGAARRIRAALVVGSLIEPESVGNPHIRAHASEGRLFRTVLADALGAHGITSEIIVDKQLSSRAVAEIGRTAAHIARAVSGFGESIGRPWRADEKAAATAAWIALC